MRVVIVLALVGAALAAPRDHGFLDAILRSPRIVGGVEASIEEFPFMAHLLLLSSWTGTFDPHCGGSLIKPTAVLSAAHCLVNGIYPTSSWRVRVGSALIDSGGVVLEVKETIIHPDYIARLLIHDVAVIKLATSAELSEKVGIATLALPDSVVPDNTLVTAIGFGLLSMDSHRPEVLQKVDVYKINNQLCAERYAYLKTIPGFENTPDITPEKMCAGILNVGGKDACGGDSGGPLLYNSTVVGIVSWGHDCAHPFFPGVYARAAPYYNWITKNS